MDIAVQKLHKDAKLPERFHHDDAGMDLFCLEEVVLSPGERKAVDTGIAMAIPTGYVGLIWDKSSIPLKFGVKSMGGVVDAQYRGEVKVIMINLSDEKQIFASGTKIAQMLIQPIVLPIIKEVKALGDTTRGEGGFGSTGTH